MARKNERIYCEPGSGFYADPGDGSEPGGPFNTSAEAEAFLRGAPAEPKPLGEIHPDDVRRVADFAQEEAAHQDDEAADVEHGPDGWADATDDDYAAASEEAQEIRDDGDRVSRVAGLIHERADVVAAILAADETALRQARLLLGVPFPTEAK